MELSKCKKCIHYHSNTVDEVTYLYYPDLIMERTLLISDNKKFGIIIDCPIIKDIEKENIIIH